MKNNSVDTNVYGKEFCSVIFGNYENNKPKTIIASFILFALKLGVSALFIGRLVFWLFIFKDIALAKFKRLTIERATEYLWLFENLKNEVNFKILDVGCSESLLCFELVARKYDVYGVDTRDYRGKPAMLKFFKADAAKLPFSDNFFNQITMISTLEHIGIGAFNDPKYEGAETEVLNELKRILSKEGKLYLSVPYCDKYTVTWQRYYDRETLNKLLDGNFNIISKTIYIRDKSRWIRCEEKDVSGIATNRTNCIACLMLSKK